MAKILIIDDEVGMRKLLARAVTIVGHTPITASNLTEAKKEFTEHSPDVVICDVQLRLESGTNLHRLLIERGLPVARFLFMTGGCSIPEEHYIQNSQSTLIEKPFKLNDLYNEVANALAS